MTAYDMRISDWSSDVCSSDLGGRRHHGWYREEEGEFSRRRALHAKQAGADNGGARARHAGDHGEALQQADLQAHAELEVVDAGHLAADDPPFDEPEARKSVV